MRGGRQGTSSGSLAMGSTSLTTSASIRSGAPLAGTRGSRWQSGRHQMACARLQDARRASSKSHQPRRAESDFAQGRGPDPATKDNVSIQVDISNAVVRE
jgi:hypothetical protein